MANALYDYGREGFLGGAIDWDTDDIRFAFLSAGYTPNLSTHQFVSDLGANIVARSTAIASPTVTAGVANHAAKTVSAVSGAQITRIAYYKYNAADASARLICLIDTATNLPVTPNGGDITVTPDAGANKLFKL
jgi:hypothetical protein